VPLQYGVLTRFSRGRRSSEYYCWLGGEESRLLVRGCLHRFGMISMTPLPQRVMHEHAFR
jgi:hypothetical protein